MAIRVQYTPYGAVGKLAQAGGRAQQAVRDQNYAESQASQQRAIDANASMQAQSLSQQATLAEQQLAWNTASQDKTLAAQRDSQAIQFQQNQIQMDYSRMAQRDQLQLDYSRLEQQQDQFDVQQLASERVFALRTAQDQRVSEQAIADIEQRKVLDLRGLEQITRARETQAAMLDEWKTGQYDMDPDAYRTGLIQIMSGKAPNVFDPLSPYQAGQLALRRERMSQTEAENVQDTEDRSFTRGIREGIEADIKAYLDPTLGYGAHKIWDESKEDLINTYARLADTYKYINMSTAQRTDFDAMWDSGIQRGAEQNWDKTDDRVQAIRNLPSKTEQFKSDVADLKQAQTAGSDWVSHLPADRQQAVQQALAAGFSINDIESKMRANGEIR